MEKGGDTSDREIVITREFDAPRELVWEAMTNPKHVVNWWGPRGFSTTIEKMDFRVGGVWKHVMRGPDGVNYPNQSVFKEIVKPERIVFSHGGKREGGPGVSFVSTWTFEKLAADKTRVTIRMVFPSAAEPRFCRQGIWRDRRRQTDFGTARRIFAEDESGPGALEIIANPR